MISAWFLSDIHLQNEQEWRSEKLLHFLFELRSGARNASHLIFVGDIFDFWVGDHDFYYRQFQKIIDAIVQLKKNGVQVFYFEGNHDVHIKKFWESRFQIPCFIDTQEIQIGSSLVRIEHGDYINPNDRVYHRYLKLIRGPFIRFLSHRLPAAAVARIGHRASLWSRSRPKKHRESREVRAERIRKLIRTYADHVFQQTPFDYLITGHVHVQDVYRLPSGMARYAHPTSVNLGSWAEPENVSVGRLDDSGFEFIKI